MSAHKYRYIVRLKIRNYSVQNCFRMSLNVREYVEEISAQIFGCFKEDIMRRFLTDVLPNPLGCIKFR